ncbi:NF-kappa-B-repressing factor [Biomphalaria pfeifferi]|uniref:NF-kappa-B-repressing factor n=1 Tax=Biomphalaria pfeifferi TaxID=112525 RepID=A0AAD8C2W9_BIOPF|nr:NF-kappa-B-repressing factor [Biomphalaria pfeifferi]
MLFSDQEDLLLSNEFSLEQSKVIHGISKELKLKCNSRGKGQERYLCIHRKRTSNQLFSHIMSCGGETAKYKLLPPGENLSA